MSHLSHNQPSTFNTFKFLLISWHIFIFRCSWLVQIPAISVSDSILSRTNFLLLLVAWNRKNDLPPVWSMFVRQPQPWWVRDSRIVTNSSPRSRPNLRNFCFPVVSKSWILKEYSGSREVPVNAQYEKTYSIKSDSRDWILIRKNLNDNSPAAFKVTRVLAHKRIEAGELNV